MSYHVKCSVNGLLGCLARYWLFGIFALAALIIGVFHLNQPLFYDINSIHSMFSDSIWIVINSISNAKFFILPLILLLVIFLFRRDKLIKVAVLIGVYYVGFLVIKKIIGEARPFTVLPLASFHWLIYGESHLGAEYMSFPSGHVGMASVFVFTLITLFFEKNILLQLILFIFLILVAVARICSGWHWPLDVICSGLLGYLLVKLFFCGCNKNCKN